MNDSIGVRVKLIESHKFCNVYFHTFLTDKPDPTVIPLIVDPGQSIQLGLLGFISYAGDEREGYIEEKSFYPFGFNPGKNHPSLLDTGLAYRLQLTLAEQMVSIYGDEGFYRWDFDQPHLSDDRKKN